MPEAQATGSFHLVVWGSDQTHTPYDFTATIAFDTSCKVDSDCPPNSYCETWKVPPTCH